MNRFAVAMAVLACAATPGSLREANAAEIPKILAFDTMAGVTAPYTGTTNPIRNVAGGGLPWVLDSAKGELLASGKLEVEVTGLVIDPTAASGAAGTNPSSQFRVIVSCLSTDSSSNPTIVNVETDPFDATTGPAALGGGNAKVEAFVSLPTPCIAPIVFVTNPARRWFAATGR